MAGRNRFGSIRFGSVIFDEQSVGFGSVSYSFLLWMLGALAPSFCGMESKRPTRLSCFGCGISS